MISYEPLYRTLEKLQMPMSELSAKIGFAPTSLGSSISHKENLTSLTIDKICGVLGCEIKDVVENVLDGTVIEHKMTIIRRERANEKLVFADWSRISADIAKAGYSDHSLSLALNKAGNFIAKKRKLKHITVTCLKEIADAIHTNYQDYI